jgi:hypothetical protein
VAEQGGADVDRQAVVDQLGGEDPPEVVRGEPDPASSISKVHPRRHLSLPGSCRTSGLPSWPPSRCPR